MRLIDFTMTQVLALINQPELLTLNQNYKSLHMQDKSAKPKRVFGELQQQFYKFMNPTFMDIQVNAKNLHVLLKPWPHNQEYFQLEIDSATVRNTQYKTRDRFTDKKPPLRDLPEVWVDRYAIQVNKTEFSFKHKKETTRLALPFKINMWFDMLTGQNEILQIYP